MRFYSMCNITTKLYLKYFYVNNGTPHHKQINEWIGANYNLF